jgi:F0F1-type ATP synthase alpha subunit
VGMIWAVQNGVVDDVPVERIKEFQGAWAEFLTTRKEDLLSSIRTQKELSKELTDGLKAAAEQFKSTWKEPSAVSSEPSAKEKGGPKADSGKRTADSGQRK